MNMSRGIALGVGAACAIWLAPMLIIAALDPGQAAHTFVYACTQMRGARAAVLPDPPDAAIEPGEVLLRIATTATTLGVGRQGATVAAAISLQATGLTQAANPDVPDSLRYAHSTQTRSGVGALGLPASWGSPAELMTPQVSAALVIDRMLNLFPDWRDTDPAEMAALIRGGTATDYTAAVTAAQTRLDRLPPPPTNAPPPSPGPTTVAATTPPHSPPPPAPLLTLDQARAAARDLIDVADCAAALTAPIPPAAPGPNPHGAQLAAAAQHAVGVTPRLAQAPAFVADTAAAIGVRVPDTLAGQFAAGWSVDQPSPGDLVFTDISADQGPHLVGIAVAADTMVTVLPGHPHPEWVRIGPSHVARRLEVRTS